MKAYRAPHWVENVTYGSFEFPEINYTVASSILVDDLCAESANSDKKHGETQ